MSKPSSRNNNNNTLVFHDGAIQFRQRLILSFLSHRPVLIRNIRNDDLESPGLQAHEVSFLKLLDSITNGTTIEINNTGTQVRLKPGVLLGGSVEHDTNNSGRSVGWFLEGILPLAPFGKKALRLTLQGITDGTCGMDPSPDYLSKSAVPLLQRFMTIDEDDPPSIRVLKRGAAPLGGGLVEFYCGIQKELRPLDLVHVEKIHRVRGLCVSCNTPASSSARASHAAKGMLLRLIPNVWIHTQCTFQSNNTSGPSPSLSMCLTAETDNGVLSAEACLDKDTTIPEDLGIMTAAMLLEEVRRGGCIDTGVQWLALLLMCMGPEDVSRIRVGTLSQHTIESLRLYKQALGVEFKVTPDHETQTVLLSCLGTGFTNMAKKST